MYIARLWMELNMPIIILRAPVAGCGCCCWLFNGTLRHNNNGSLGAKESSADKAEFSLLPDRSPRLAKVSR